MNPILIILFLANYFLLNLKTETNTKNVLSKAKDDERSIPVRIAPYIIVLMCFIILVLGLWVLISHGQHITATEANLWYNGELA